MFLKKELNPDDFVELKVILEIADNTLIETTNSFGNLFFTGDNYTTELYLKTHLDNLIISRIMFKNQHIGTSTKVLNFLKQYCNQNNFTSIIVESTSTPQINSFCKKHQFNPIENQGFFDKDGEFYGNYILKL